MTFGNLLLLAVSLCGKAIPILLFYATFQPYFAGFARAFVGAVAWAGLYGIAGTMAVNLGPEAVPMRLLFGFLYMGVGLAACELIARLVTYRK